MIKAASKLLFLLVLFSAVAQLPAQTVSDDVDQSIKEAVKRQADTITLKKKLVLAESALQRKDWNSAAILYQECYGLVQQIGSSVDPEKKRVVAGLTAVLTELANQAQAHHDYAAADGYIRRILIVDPTNQVVLAMQQKNNHMLEISAGRRPSPELLQKIPDWRTNEVKVATMVQDARLLFEAGKYDEADLKLEQALKLDPDNVPAYAYQQMIREKQYSQAQRKTEMASRSSIVQVEQSWDVPLRHDRLQAPNQFARSTETHLSKGRRSIQEKLDRITLDTVKYDGLSLPEVINSLTELSRQRDPDGLGVNFMINRQAPPAAPAAAGGIDPTTGLPIAAIPTEAPDIGSVTVKINPPLSHLRLADVLEAVTMGADKPIQVSVGDWAVTFSLKTQDPIPLATRTFHVDPNTFVQGLENVIGITFANVTTSSGGGGGQGGGGGGQGGANGQTSITTIPQVQVAGNTGGGGGGGQGGGQGGGGGTTGAGLRFVSTTNTVDQVQNMVRNFFIAAGVDFNTNNPANIGKAIVFNDRKGVLMVRASTSDLDLIATAMETLNATPPEINIKAKFAEITQNDNRAIGFDWILGNTLLGSGRAALSGGTQPTFNGQQTTANPGGTFPGTITPTADTTLPPSASDGLLTSGLRNGLNSPAVASLTGVLTDPQFKLVIHALEQRDGVDVLTAPEITTVSGRQAQVQAVDVQTIVTGVNVANGTGNNQPAGNNTIIQNSSPTANFNTQPLPFGPVLDVIPYVSADEFSIQMTIIPTVTEFVGYDDPGQFVPQAIVANQGGTATPLRAQLPLPHFRVRQVVTSAVVWDSQTIVLGGLISDSVTQIKDKIPVLGDIPFLGRLFKSESSAKSKKNLMIFVTPTIINPDGTRFHSDDEMPFAQSGVPAQRPVTQ